MALEDERPKQDDTAVTDEQDAGIRIRGEAPATGRLEDEGVVPAAAPSNTDASSPGSLQGSKRGIGTVVSGAETREQSATAESQSASAEPRFRRTASSAAAVDSELAESQGLERDLGEEASARVKSDKGEA